MKSCGEVPVVIKNSSGTSSERKFWRTIGHGIVRVNSAEVVRCEGWKKPKGMVSADLGAI
jgi:hypothetical protein